MPPRGGSLLITRAREEFDVAGNRKERVARVIREEASRVVLYELADPRIGFVTVTKVKVSADLQHARIYVSVMGDSPSQDETMAVLERAARVVQRAVGPRLKMRTIPRIEFEFDPSVEGSIRVSALIREARATDADAVAGKSEATGDESSAAADAPDEDTTAD
jgi:ribosome-binding factor A